MGRELKRKLTKELKNLGVSDKHINDLFVLKDMQKQKNVCLQEGQRVKLNIKKIKDNTDYKRLQEKYKKFVEEHKDDVFTVEYDKRHMNEPIVVCLKEDTTVPKWLFRDSDLEVVTQ